MINLANLKAETRKTRKGGYKMVDLQEIVDKIDGFMEKKGLDTQSKHNVCKLLQESYWEKIKEQEDEEELDDFDDFDDLEADNDDDLDIPEEKESVKEKPKPVGNIQNLIAKGNKIKVK
jgi:hypothetical protein